MIIDEGIFEYKHNRHLKIVKNMINYKYTFRFSIEEIRAFYNKYYLEESLVKEYIKNFYIEDIRYKLSLLFTNVNVRNFEYFSGFPRRDDFIYYFLKNLNFKKYLRDGFLICNKETYEILKKEALKIKTKRRRRIYLMFLNRTFFVNFEDNRIVLWYTRDNFKIITNGCIEINKINGVFESSFCYKFKILNMEEKLSLGMNNWDYYNVNNNFYRPNRYKSIKFRIFTEL